MGHMRDTKTKGRSRVKILWMCATVDFFFFFLMWLLILIMFIMCSFFLTGIWVWGTPIEMDIDGVKSSVLYLDTEGFESIGKSNVYDDR